MAWISLLNLALGLLFSSTPVAPSVIRPRDTALTHRDETTEVYATAGTYEDFQPGYLAGVWELFKRDEYVSLSGTGYLRVRWEVEYWQGVGPIYEPTFDASGTFLFVAGGGGFQFGDAYDGGCSHGSGCVNRTGADDYGYSYFPDGYNPWINMYYYLDGSVTITNHESGGAYNVGVAPIAYDDVLSDINTAPTDENTKYGYSYDPSEGSCPCSEG